MFLDKISFTKCTAHVVLKAAATFDCLFQIHYMFKQNKTIYKTIAYHSVGNNIESQMISTGILLMKDVCTLAAIVGQYDCNTFIQQDLKNFTGVMNQYIF